MSQSSFPTKWFFANSRAYPTSESKVVDRIAKINSFSDARDYFISFNIYYDDLSYTLVEESPFWDVFALFSNIGGNLGLFVGMSFLSFVEVFELLYGFLDFLILRGCFFANHRKVEQIQKT